MTSLSLSKSKFINGLQCHKSLWLHKNRLDLKGETGAATQAIFDQGSSVGELAQGLFPGGETIRYEDGTFEEKITRTKELIKSGVKTIYEATIQYDDILVMVDILHKGKGGWELYEVKSSTEVKAVHENDVAVQYYVLNGSGIKLKKASLVYINNQYTRQGNLDIQQLFNIDNLTKSAKVNQDFVKSELKKMRKAIKKGEPRIDIGPHCSDPYECDFQEHCWKHVPDPSVFNISRLGTEKKWALYDDGILKFKDIPKDFGLNANQMIQVKSELTGKDFIDKEAIKEFLSTLHYPLYFLDFETMNPAIPPFDGIRPYQRTPFQYSLHYQKKKGGKVYHEEFLAEEGTDPKKKLAQGLVDNIPKDSCVLAYSAGFEKSVIRELAEDFPKLKKKLIRIHDSIEDLIIPFRSKAYYTKDMNGSASLKYVLPAVVPKMKKSYKKLEISNGGQASGIYSTLHLVDDKKKRKKIRKELIEYCTLDTFGMIKILEELDSL